MAITEARLKADLVHVLKSCLPLFVIIRHEDRFTSGIPDLSITGRGLTSWWEGKHANPRIKSDGIQELMMKRLSRAGFARYIIWEDTKDVQQTRVVFPTELGEWTTAGTAIKGFDHHWILELVRKVHS